MYTNTNIAKIIDVVFKEGNISRIFSFFNAIKLSPILLMAS